MCQCCVYLSILYICICKLIMILFQVFLSVPLFFLRLPLSVQWSVQQFGSHLFVVLHSGNTKWLFYCNFCYYFTMIWIIYGNNFSFDILIVLPINVEMISVCRYNHTVFGCFQDCVPLFCLNSNGLLFVLLHCESINFLKFYFIRKIS